MIDPRALAASEGPWPWLPSPVPPARGVRGTWSALGTETEPGEAPSHAAAGTTACPGNYGHSGHSPAEQHGQRSLQPDPQGHVRPSVPFPSKTGPRPQRAASRCHPAAAARGKERPETSLCVGGSCSRGRPGPSTCRKDAGCTDPSSAGRVGLGRTGWSQPCSLRPRCHPSLKEGEASVKSVPVGSGGLQAALFDHYN